LRYYLEEVCCGDMIFFLLLLLLFLLVLLLLLLGRTYLAPICPRRVCVEKVMSMRVTSGGSTAAPAPFLMESSYLCVNGRVFDRRSCEALPSTRRLVLASYLEAGTTGALTCCRCRVRLNTLTILTGRGWGGEGEELCCCIWGISLPYGEVEELSSDQLFLDLNVYPKERPGRAAFS
jgi:hypothetical protein